GRYLDGTFGRGGHARAILSVLNPADQRILFGRVVGNALSVRDTERMAGELNGGSRAGGEAGKKKKEKGSDSEVLKDIEVRNIEQKFIDALGTKVSMKGTLVRGTIEISYFSRDDLERIYEIIGSNSSPH
ncbi:MAG TPA: hypothetical protein PK542_00710, partial [Treponemataceae bacterium]|nr:hypothetical protein [Treponemataceae bacterium]